MRRSHSLRAVVLGLAAICAACAGKGSEVLHIHANASQQELADAAYMGRDLLPAQYRSAVIHDITTRYNPTSTVVASAGVAAAGVAPLSRAGMPVVGTVDLGLSVASGLLDGPPHGYPLISLAALPGTVGGQLIADADAATRFMQSHVVARLEEWGRLYGRSVRCVYRCGGDTPAYELRRVGPPHLPYYDPERLYVSVIPWGGMIRAPQNPIRDRILGFAAAWTSKGPDGFRVCMDPAEKMDFAPDGSLTEKKDPIHGTIANIGCRSSFTSPLERALLRILTRDGYLTLGGDFIYNQQISLKGHVYSIDTLEKANYVRYEIAPETDTPNLR